MEMKYANSCGRPPDAFSRDMPTPRRVFDQSVSKRWARAPTPVGQGLGVGQPEGHRRERERQKNSHQDHSHGPPASVVPMHSECSILRCPYAGGNANWMLPQVERYAYRGGP